MSGFLSPRPPPQIRASCWDFSSETEIYSLASLELVILPTDPLADILSLLAPDPGIADLTGHDCGEKLLLVLSLKGRMTRHHLVQHHSKRPPIDL